MPDAPDAAPDFAKLYESTLAPLRRYLARLTGSQIEAQDLAHDAYARVFPALKDRPVEQPRAFLYTTARHLALDQLKRRSRSPVAAPLADDPPEPTAASPATESLVMAREEWAHLEHAIATLPAGCRRVLLLRKLEGLSHAEIADRLGLARSSVEKHLLRATRLLHEALAETGTSRSPAPFPFRETRRASSG